MNDVRTGSPRAQDGVANRIRPWKAERGEVASWLLIAAALAAAAMGASLVLSHVIGSLANEVATAAEVPSAQVAVAAGGGTGGAGDTIGIGEIDLGAGLTAADGTADEIVMRNGERALKRTGPDGQVAFITAGEDDTINVVHVDAEGNIIRAQAEVTETDGERGFGEWHFEGRADLNVDLPSTIDDIGENDGWTELTPGQSEFHDDPLTADPERKFIHTDGREAVYNPYTRELVTDPRYAGTYNYVNPAPMPAGENAWSPTGWASWTFRGIGHVVADIIPYFFGRNIRGPDPVVPPRPVFPGDGDGDGGYTNSLTDAPEGPSVCGSCGDGGGGGYDNPELDGHASAAG